MTALPEAYEGLLAGLDRLKEYVPGDPRNLYERVTREVVREADGTAVRAWVYVAAVAARLRPRADPHRHHHRYAPARPGHPFTAAPPILRGLSGSRPAGRR